MEDQVQTKKKVLVVGSTGLVGSQILYGCFSHPDIESIISVDATENTIEHSKLMTVVHDNFLDFSSIAPVLTDIDIVFYCIGVKKNASKERFKTVTIDVTKAFSSELKKHSPEATFCFLSSAGADPTGKSTNMVSKRLGQAENVLNELQFSNAYIFRPSYMSSEDGSTPVEEILKALQPIITLLNPNASVDFVTIARAMIQTGLHGWEGAVLENKDIRKAAIENKVVTKTVVEKKKDE